MGLIDRFDSETRTPALILGALLALLLALGGVWIIQARTPDPPIVLSLPSSSTTSSSTSSTSTSSTSSTSVPSTTTPPVTQVGGSAPTVATTRPPLGTAPTPTIPVQTTVPPPVSPSCAPAQIAETVTTDKTTYNPGEMVRVTVTVRNQSSTPCAVPDPGSNCSALASIYSVSDTHPFWRSGGVPIPCTPSARRTLLPGASAPFNAAWDQIDRRGCPSSIGNDPGCGTVRVPGTYTVRSSWVADATAPNIQLV